MFSKLVILFTIIPLLELYLLIKAGSIIGGSNTILIVILTGIVGAAFAKSQGYSTIMNIREKISLGQIPGNELVQGILILAGGITLLTPGFITDLAGFTLLIPWTRKIYATWLISYFSNKIRGPHSQFYSSAADHFRINGNNIIDVDDPTEDPDK